MAAAGGIDHNAGMSNGVRQVADGTSPREVSAAGRYVRFCLVGGSGVVVDMAVLWALADPANLGWNLSLSKALAAEVALLNNFVWNELWTFRGLGGAGWRARLGRLLKFNLICAAGIGWSVLLLQLQVGWLGWNVYLANLIAIVLVSLWNFWLNLKLGWRAGPGRAAETGGETPARGQRSADPQS
ncbi:MAG: GtrA family protein [Verrucomicrobia bacterium]|nr:MAG: GtrA family protein [Verrucomicrobiota bacterium]